MVICLILLDLMLINADCCLMLQMVKLLLEKGATINAFDKKDRRAIHWAAYMGHVDVVRLLVSFGAELRCTDTQVSSGTEVY